MRKLLLPLLATMATAFTACDNKSEHTIKVLGFYPIGRDIVIYADQTLDTTYSIAATQNWEITSNATWLTPSPTSGKVREGKVAEHKLKLTTTLNTTDQVRQGVLTLQSSIGTVSRPIQQLHLLHLTQPDVLREENRLLYGKYIGTDTTRNNTNIRLRLYTTTAKVRSEASWIHVPDTATYTPGDTTIQVTLDRNLTGESRHGYITLYTPEGITTPVRFVQVNQP
ncbi:MAG: BACON domain-containing carbohydrate-binding protein [Bacteroidales bacterium]|nr:BACON domain-containing carbohydrate-binding protein [Bacteroidales bacterium]